MGHYTNLHLRFRLKPDLDMMVKTLLEKIYVHVDKPDNVFWGDTSTDESKQTYLNNLGMSHKFFNCQRWLHCLTSDMDDHTSSLVWSNFSYVLTINTEFKNYHNEIELFLDWISPRILNRKKRKHLGWWQPCCDHRERIHIHIDEFGYIYIYISNNLDKVTKTRS